MAHADYLPDFRLPASTGQTLSKESFLGKVPVILVFLPGLARPAAVEAIAAFDRKLVDFGHERVQVLGVAQMTASELRDFVTAESIKVPILADPAGQLHRAAGVPTDRTDPEQTTLVYDTNGLLLTVILDTHPADHATRALASIKALLEPEPGGPPPAE